MNLSLTEIIKRRRSIRDFRSEDIDNQTIKTIIDTAAHAPSNNNRQGWKFIVVKDKGVIQNLSALVESKLSQSKNKNQTADDFMEDYQGNFTTFKQAPVLIICCHVKPAGFNFKLFETDEENRHFTGELISVSMAMQNIVLLAESMDIGTLIMTAPLIAAREIKEALSIPKRLTIAGFICMGRYETRPEPPKRKPLNDILIIKSTGETD